MFWLGLGFAAGAVIAAAVVVYLVRAAVMYAVMRGLGW